MTRCSLSMWLVSAGPKGSSPDIPIGVFEIATIDPHHPGWLDCGDGVEEEGTQGEACINGKFGRFVKTFSCIQESGCNETSTLNGPYDEHAMGVASVLFGDVTGGQDPGIEDKIAQVLPATLIEREREALFVRLSVSA